MGRNTFVDTMVVDGLVLFLEGGTWYSSAEYYTEIIAKE